jgi:nicotinamidase/pyrazinamidase
MKNEILFWDVDTQYDFMRPEGCLYVPGAEGIIDNVNKARRFALDNGYSLLASMDWHKDGNPEISDKPDFETTFPPHCMADKPGSERVGYLGNLTIDITPNEPMSDTDLRKLLDKKQFHIVIRKEELDVFTNPNMATLIGFLKPESVVIFGVALDLCLRMAVEGLLKMGGMKLYLLKDAVKGLGIQPNDTVLEKFRQQGVEIISIHDLNKIS